MESSASYLSITCVKIHRHILFWQAHQLGLSRLGVLIYELWSVVDSLIFSCERCFLLAQLLAKIQYQVQNFLEY